nr:PAS domain-containing protein [Aureimonas psammosilenae]
MSPSEIAAAFIHPEDGPEVVASFQTAREGTKPHVFEHRIRSATGEYRWFPDRAEPYRDGRTGEILRWFGAAIDINDRKLAEDRLRELNATLEERVAERTVERNMLDLLADQPEQQAEVRAGWARGLSGEQVTVIEEFGDPDRARPYYEVKFRPLFKEAGRQIGTYQFVTDVTECLRRGAQLLEAQEALRQSQKTEAIGQLTGGVASDVTLRSAATLPVSSWTGE